MKKDKNILSGGYVCGSIHYRGIEAENEINFEYIFKWRGHGNKQKQRQTKMWYDIFRIISNNRISANEKRT